MVIAKDLRLVEDYEDEGLEIEMTTLPEPSEYSDDQDPLPVQYDDTWQSQPAQPDWNSWFSGPRYDQGNSIDQSWDQDNWNWPWNQQTAPSSSFARPNLPISTMNTPSTTTNITTATTATTTTTVSHEVTMAVSINNRCLTEPVGTHCDVCADGYHGDKCQYSGKPSKTCRKTCPL